MNTKLHCLLCLLLSASLVLAEDSKQDIKSHKEPATTANTNAIYRVATTTQNAMPSAINMTPTDMKWGKIFPDLGDKSSEITMLHIDPQTGASQLMIRVPPNFHVPKHWHSANETHTVLSGTFIMECEGHTSVLPAGSFNYTPKTMQHEAWTKPDEGALLFITVDSTWDINWVNSPPKPNDLIGGKNP